jgi:PST family polysaccharide transporter
MPLISKLDSIIKTGSITFFTSLGMIFSLITNKLVAVYASTYGIALFGIAKNFHSLFASILKLGSENVILNRASNTDQTYSSNFLLSSIMFLLLFQLFFSLVLYFLFADFIFVNFFSKLLSDTQYGAFRIIFGLSLISCFYELLLAYNNGKLRLKRVIGLGYIGSILTLLTCFLIKPSNPYEIVFLSLSSGFFSIIFLIILSYKELISSFKISRPTNRKLILSNSYSLTSISLAIQPIIATGCIFSLNQVLLRIYGVDEYALFVAAFTLSTMILTMGMSSIRVYFFPKSSSLKEHQEKINFLYQNLIIFLPITFFVTLLVSSFGGLIITSLYSQDFVKGLAILESLIVFFPIQVFSWITAYFLLSNQQYKSFSFADCIKEIIIVTTVIIIYAIDLSLIIHEMLLISFFLGYLMHSILMMIFILKNNIKNIKIILFWITSLLFSALIFILIRL